MGESILIEYRYANGQPELLDSFVRDLLASQVDLIVATNSPAIAGAQRATARVPIVMVSSGDPVGAGFVAGLNRPGGNITGMTSLSAELARKRLELLKEVYPALSRVGVLWDPTNPIRKAEWDQSQSSGEAIGVQTESLQVSTTEDIEAALQGSLASGVDALMVFGDSIIVLNRDKVLKHIGDHHVPAVFEGGRWATDGGLMSYGPSLAERFRRAATYVDKILRGADPAGIPVEGPTKFELSINLKTAEALGLSVPAGVVARAEQVIR